jgi:peptidoglycan hydrolase-like protein with peptidoglycan-binding domain
VKRWLTVPRPKVPVRLLVAALVLALVAVVAIVLVMNGQQSPDDIRRARRAPNVRAITAKLVRQVLEVSFMDSEASYRYSDPRPVTLAGSLAKSGATQVVTQVPVDGQVISDNRVVMNVAGRPVISIQVDPISTSGLPCVDTNLGTNLDTSQDKDNGDGRACAIVPMYRDLRTGDRGQDVAQLQAALKRLGFLTEVNGRFESTTSTAVSAWYESLGLEPFDPTQTNPAAPAGVMVPANEVLFFRGLPQRVDEVKALVGGTTASDPVFTASGTKLVVASQVSVERLQYVRIGMPVSLIDQNAAESTGVVRSVATKPGGTAREGLYAVEIETTASKTPAIAVKSSTNTPTSTNVSNPDQPSLPDLRAVAGLPLRVNYPVTRSPEPLLTVPVTGLFPCAASQPGTECIRVTSDAGDTFYEVRITRIMTSSNGLVGFDQPVASVKEGDTVVINNPAPSKSDVGPGPEDLGEFSIPPATVNGVSGQQDSGQSGSDQSGLKQSGSEQPTPAA